MTIIIEAAGGGNAALVPFTWFERNNKEVGQRFALPWRDLCQWIIRIAPTLATKDELPLIKLATFEGDRRTNDTMEAIYGVEGDYDGEGVQPDAAAALLTKAGILALIYTTPRHRLHAPRWRVLCPLSQAGAAGDRQSLVACLNGVLGGVLAVESFTPSQAFYIGGLTGGERVQYWEVQGRCLDTIDGLPSTGPRERVTGPRKPLGSMPAPTLNAAVRALYSVDPNDLDRDSWMKHSAAFRQSATGLVTDDMVKLQWDGWCAQYQSGAGNDLSDNGKLWRSFNNGTDVGWTYLRDHASEAVRASLIFDGVDRTGMLPNTTTAIKFGEYLTPDEQRQWFSGCTLIGPDNRIIDSKGQSYDVGAFNSTFGGKYYIIDMTGKKTNEAWQAATRSTVWTIPKVDGTCFRPDLATGTIITDELDRRSVNIYRPANIDRMEGDASPFLNHLTILFPNANDQRVLLDYLAHNAKYPGYKIPWAPVIQSAEGAGKNIFKYAMTHVMGDHYTYPPNAKELATGGGKFNDWMNRKLFLIADEIKTDDKRDMVEVLKPMISEITLEMQRKGFDQRKADNPANWLFFTNWKDAIPVHANGRRFAVFYSTIQSAQDALNLGMNDGYFRALYDDWLGIKTHKRGLKIIANYLLTYPIERGVIAMRAPHTSSMAEAILESRGWLECLIADAVESQRSGFMAGWVNTAAVGTLLREHRREAQTRTIGDALRSLGYHRIAQAGRGWLRDDPNSPNRRGWLWNTDPLAMTGNYGSAQNYE